MEGDLKHVILHWMGGEISNFIKVWLSVYVSLCYCYFAAKIVPKGIKRLLAFLPVVCFFLFLPLNLHSMHLGGITSFFVAWLANFKILNFAFEKGPLSDPSISLLRFVSVGCLPIEIQPSKPPKSKENGENISRKNPSDQNGHLEKIVAHETLKQGQKTALNYAVKGLLLALFVKFYDYSEHLHPKIILVIYCFHIYFSLELMLAITAALARGLLGVELEPQFNEPILSSSLQDFWGHRWNLMVTRTLRPSVYDPVKNLSTKILGQKYAPLPAIMVTFIVSAIMHELIFYYLGRVKPTWEITCFFLLHGVCLMVEVAAKKAFGAKIHVPRFMSTMLTAAFLMVTGFWLFFPQLLRCKADIIGFEEYAAVGAFVRDVGKALTSTSLTSSNSTRSTITYGI